MPKGALSAEEAAAGRPCRKRALFGAHRESRRNVIN